MHNINKRCNIDGMMKPVLYFATSNPYKLREAREILTDYEVQSIHIDLPELQGEPRDIIYEKTRVAVKKINKLVFVEDVSLSCNALGGLPGPYIKWFLDKMGNRIL